MGFQSLNPEKKKKFLFRESFRKRYGLKREVFENGMGWVFKDFGIIFSLENCCESLTYGS